MTLICLDTLLGRLSNSPAFRFPVLDAFFHLLVRPGERGV